MSNMKWKSGGTHLGRLALALAFAAGPVSVEAATFGVPTSLDVTGQTTGGSANPQGWFLITGLDSPPEDGDLTHQIRVFIDVPSTTLDIRVFDAGTSGARDEDNDDDLRVTFQLLNPCTPFPTCTGTVRSQVANLDDDTNASTQNRLARFTPGNNGFFAISSGNGNNVPFTGLTPGRYEFRASATTNSDDVDFFGVDIRDQAGNSLNAFTIGRTGAPAAGLVTGTNNAGGTPPGITQPITVYPFVDRGCTMQPSNFDMDSTGGPGAGSSASILDVSSTTTTLALSPDSTHAETTVVVEPTSGVNTESTNYGMFTLTNDTGTQRNWLEWRMADFQGWADNPANAPRDPTNPLRIYLPNRASIGSGTFGTAPSAPVLRTSLRYISGPNPPATGQATRFGIYGHLDNLSAQSITSAQITIGVPAPTVVDTATPMTAYLEGVATTCSASTQTSSLVSCTFASAVPSGQTATIFFFVTLTPPAPGTYLLTGADAAPTATGNARGSFTITGINENVGPVCELRVDTSTIITRATLRGVRVDAGGLVEFAVATQRGTQGFDLYGTNDRLGRGDRVKLNAAPIPAPVPDSLTPILYRAHTRPVTTRYLVIEEIERGGRRHALGPLPVGDARLRSAFERVEQRLDRAGATSPRGGGESRLTPGRLASGLVARQERPHARTAPARLGPGVKIEIDRVGLVRVPFADLHANGLPGNVPWKQLRLSNQGLPVPFRVDNGANGRALLFEGQALSTAYTGVNAYVLTWKGQAPGMKVGLTSWAAPKLPGFRRVEKNTFFVPSAPQGSDPWKWDLLFGDGTPWPYDYDPGLGDFDIPGLDPNGSGQVAVQIRFAGASAHQHTVEASINGVPVGSVNFLGSETGTLKGEVPFAALLESGNQLQLVYTAAGDPDDLGLIYLDELDLGLPDPPLDEIAPLAVSPYNPNLVGGARSADYLILTHPLFEGQAAAIAATKASAGYHPVVMSVERAYDRYSGGLVEAGALRALFAELKRAGLLRYALLLGDDSFDSQDFMGLGLVSYVPSLYAWDENFGRVPSENLYADVDGNGSPDLAIGRLPAQTEDQAAAMAAKIARQAQVLRQEAGTHLFGLDNDTTPVSFRAMANAVAASLPPGAQVTWADSGEGLDHARAILMAGLSQGTMLTHVFGHAGPEQWTDEALATVEDIEGLDGTPGEGVVFQWTCESQWYQFPLGSTMGEALLLVPQGGALASFGPAGITDAELQVPFYQKLYARLFQPGMTLGEAIRLAKETTARSDPRMRSVVEGWNLLGDPALRLDGGN